MHPTELIQAQLQEALTPIKHIIGVYSGKGGVGKTTVATNLAVTLAQHGSTGILDADVDCPNLHHTLGIDKRATIKDNMIIPTEIHGIKVASMAGLQDTKDTAIIWRGPQVTKAVMQLITKTKWGKLDYLVIDLPPGTSDAPITVMQRLKPQLILIVMTPQPVATTDAHKSKNMADKLGIPTMLIENMTGEMFGESRGQATAKTMGIPYLGTIPLTKSIREAGDHGTPAVLHDPALQATFTALTEEVLRALKT